MKEAVDRGRTLLNKVKGERHHNAVLTTAVARQIKKRAAEGIRPLARELGVSRATVKRVLQGKTWKDA
jgi:predicted transcriptional regulator